MIFWPWGTFFWAWTPINILPQRRLHPIRFENSLSVVVPVVVNSKRKQAGNQSKHSERGKIVYVGCVRTRPQSPDQGEAFPCTPCTLDVTCCCSLALTSWCTCRASMPPACPHPSFPPSCPRSRDRACCLCQDRVNRGTGIKGRRHFDGFLFSLSSLILSTLIFTFPNSPFPFFQNLSLNMFGFGDSHAQVYGDEAKHSATWSHELIAGAAAFEAAKQWEKQHPGDKVSISLLSIHSPLTSAIFR